MVRGSCALRGFTLFCKKHFIFGMPQSMSFAINSNVTALSGALCPWSRRLFLSPKFLYLGAWASLKGAFWRRRERVFKRLYDRNIRRWHAPRLDERHLKALAPLSTMSTRWIAISMYFFDTFGTGASPGISPISRKKNKKLRPARTSGCRLEEDKKIDEAWSYPHPGIKIPSGLFSNLISTWTVTRTMS